MPCLVLSGPFMNVSQLRTSTPLFKAYEEVYNKLEALCPAFHRSEQVMAIPCYTKTIFSD
jgi:hypothetical protein